MKWGKLYRTFVNCIQLIHLPTLYGGDIKILTDKAMEKHVPSKVTSKMFNQPWFNQECRRAVRMKIRWHHVYKRHKLKADWIKFQGAAKQCRKICTTKTILLKTSIDGNKKKLNVQIYKIKKKRYIGSFSFA